MNNRQLYVGSKKNFRQVHHRRTLGVTIEKNIQPPRTYKGWRDRSFRYQKSWNESFRNCEQVQEKQYYGKERHNIPVSKSPECTIISDSICREVRLANTFVQSISGLNPYRAIKAVENNALQVKKYKLIILHIGVSDLRNNIYPNQFGNAYYKLIQCIYRKNAQAKLALCGILQRPIDYIYCDLEDLRQAFNEEIKFQAYRNQAEFLMVYRRFQDPVTKGPKKYLFKYKDRAHLNRKGVQEMQQYMRGSIARILGGIRSKNK